MLVENFMTYIQHLHFLRRCLHTDYVRIVLLHFSIVYGVCKFDELF